MVARPNYFRFMSLDFRLKKRKPDRFEKSIGFKVCIKNLRSTILNLKFTSICSILV
jgi:hypothetical protein